MPNFGDGDFVHFDTAPLQQMHRRENLEKGESSYQKTKNRITVHAILEELIAFGFVLLGLLPRDVILEPVARRSSR